jgi:hypothetical protein
MGKSVGMGEKVNRKVKRRTSFAAFLLSSVLLILGIFKIVQIDEIDLDGAFEEPLDHIDD